MKKPFDRSVGPENEGKNPEAGGIPLTEREKFTLRCLNAAANLYGILPMGDFCGLYNHYAKDLPAPVSAPMDEKEAERLARSIRRRVHSNRGPDMDKSLPESWYGVCDDYDTGVPQIVHELIYESPEMYRETIDEKRGRIASWSDNFYPADIRMLPAEEFFANESYGDFPENTPQAEKLKETFMRVVGEDDQGAEDCVFSVLSSIRENGVHPDFIREVVEDVLREDAANKDMVETLVDAVELVRRTTRIWQFRGRTLEEALAAGFELDENGEFDNERDDDDGYEGRNGAEADDFDDDDGFDYDDEEGEPVRVEDLPPAKLTGPFDFKSVQDEKVRERLLWEYEGVRLATRDFVRREVMREMTKEERGDAAKRLGFPIDPKTGLIADRTLDCVAGDYAAMMDDQHGEPAIKRVLNRKDTLKDALDRAAAEYYANYRYTWLEIQAVKAGVGVKCRDLMTDEDVFLMEMNLSQSDVKGMTACVGIAPMGEVYLSLGVVHPAHFENPAAILKIVLAHLGLPTEPPIRLSFADQARFAAETIRRINANGKFGEILYGGTVTPR